MRRDINRIKMQPKSNRKKANPKTPENDVRVEKFTEVMYASSETGTLQPSAKHESAVHASDVGLCDWDLPHAPALSAQLPPPGAAIEVGFHAD